MDRGISGERVTQQERVGEERDATGRRKDGEMDVMDVEKWILVCKHAPITDML